MNGEGRHHVASHLQDYVNYVGVLGCVGQNIDLVPLVVAADLTSEDVENYRQDDSRQEGDPYRTVADPQVEGVLLRIVGHNWDFYEEGELHHI